MASPVAVYTPEEVPLPPVSTVLVFSEPQWKILLSLADTVIPCIRSAELGPAPDCKVIPAEEYQASVVEVSSGVHGSDTETLAVKYLEEHPSSLPGFKESLQRTFSQYVHQEGRNGIALILAALK